MDTTDQNERVRTWLLPIRSGFFHFAYPLLTYTSITWEFVKTDTNFRRIATACYDTTSSHASATNTGIHVPASTSSLHSAQKQKYFFKWLFFDACSIFANVFLANGYRIISMQAMFQSIQSIHVYKKYVVNFWIWLPFKVSHCYSDNTFILYLDKEQKLRGKFLQKFISNSDGPERSTKTRQRLIPN